jgi:hypothetical protein
LNPVRELAIGIVSRSLSGTAWRWIGLAAVRYAQGRFVRAHAIGTRFDSAHFGDLAQIPNAQNRRNRQTLITENGYFILDRTSRFQGCRKAEFIGKMQAGR